MPAKVLMERLAAADESRTLPEIVDAIENLVARYGVTGWALLRHPKPEKDPLSLVYAGRWPKLWPENYMKNRYVVIDPTLRYLSMAHRAYRWKEAVEAFASDPYRKRMDRMMRDAETYGLVDGYVFPVHGQAGVLGALIIAGPSLALTPVEEALFEALAKVLFWQAAEARGEPLALRKQVLSRTTLTRRELEVLYFLADGLTSVEIGRNLEISSHTVDWYTNGIQDKLGARNRQHTVALALRCGLIS